MLIDRQKLVQISSISIDKDRIELEIEGIIEGGFRGQADIVFVAEMGSQVVVVVGHLINYDVIREDFSIAIFEGRITEFS